MTANPHDFTLNHTMLRVKDPEKSLAFYCGVLGMTLLRKIKDAVDPQNLFNPGKLGFAPRDGSIDPFRDRSDNV